MSISRGVRRLRFCWILLGMQKPDHFWPGSQSLRTGQDSILSLIRYYPASPAPEGRCETRPSAVCNAPSRVSESTLSKSFQ